MVNYYKLWSDSSPYLLSFVVVGAFSRIPVFRHWKITFNLPFIPWLSEVKVKVETYVKIMPSPSVIKK